MSRRHLRRAATTERLQASDTVTIARNQFTMSLDLLFMLRELQSYCKQPRPFAANATLRGEGSVWSQLPTSLSRLNLAASGAAYRTATR